MAFQVRAQQRIAAERRGPQHDIAFGNGAGVARRQQQILAAFAGISPGWAGVLQRHLPDVDDVAVERSVVAGRRNLQHDRSGILGVEERHEIDRVRIGRERLVVPVERTRPVDDLVHLAGRLGEHLLQHQVVIDRRHAPVHGLDRAALDGAAGKVIGGRFCACADVAYINASADSSSFVMVRYLTLVELMPTWLVGRLYRKAARGIVNE